MQFLVIIRCPRTGDEVPTGRVTDVEKLDNIPNQPVQLACPACSETHSWSRVDAFLAHSLAGLDTQRLEASAKLRLAS
jgi:hypothetical protein